ATPVSLVAGAVDAYPLGRAGLAVVDEHIGRLVGVPGHEVGGVRNEGHKTAVGANYRAVGGGTARAAGAVSLVPGAVNAHPFGDAGLPVVDEHVRKIPVGVPGNEVAGPRDEGHDA